MTLMCAWDPKVERSQWKLALTHILFEVCLFMNIIVVIVYWGFLH